MKAIWDGDWKVKFEGGDGGKVAFEDVHVFSIHNLQVSLVSPFLSFSKGLLSFQMHSSVFTHLLLHSKLLDAVEDVMESELENSVMEEDNKEIESDPGKDDLEEPEIELDSNFEIGDNIKEF